MEQYEGSTVAARPGRPNYYLFTAFWALALFNCGPGAPRRRDPARRRHGAWLALLYFFRDPNRPRVSEPGLAMSAADGKVMAVVREYEPVYLRREMLRISTFLDVTDVHVQRIPLGGTVRQIVARPGKFLQAFRPEASTENESIAMEIETPYGPVLVKQIAGIMARRCVNYARPGQQMTTGERFGLIRFGSRVDLFLPLHASPLVAEGDRVYGALTPVARLEPAQD